MFVTNKLLSHLCLEANTATSNQSIESLNKCLIRTIQEAFLKTQKFCDILKEAEEDWRRKTGWKLQGNSFNENHIAVLVTSSSSLPIIQLYKHFNTNNIHWTNVQHGTVLYSVYVITNYTYCLSNVMMSMRIEVFPNWNLLPIASLHK